MRTFIYIFILVAIVSCKTGQKATTNSIQSVENAIAYNIAVKDSSGKSNYEVFTMNLDGSNSKNITNSKDVAWTYRAFRKTLYFISDRDTCYRCFFLYKTDINGNNIKKVSNLQLEDSWMDTRNNGSEIIVSGRVGKEIRYQLFLINTIDGTFTQITNDTTAYFRDPAFSPDGKQIAFIYRKNRKDKSLNDEIFIMNSDGNEIRQLTNYPKDNISYKSNGYKAGATHWHPTENFSSYISMQNGHHNIYAISPDGKKQWKLTENSFSEGWHDWSSDGKFLVFDMSNENESQYHIMLMNWKTKQIIQLTDNKFQYQQSPVFLWK
ncbi:MAG: PD40 domain-containing protein [Prolixibacteraceae bacterium]|nr:PD40 domain-containing protein [Prolixibacteraceae bacterium]